MTYVLAAVLVFVLALVIGLAIRAWRRFSDALPDLLDRSETAPEAPDSEGCRQVG